MADDDFFLSRWARRKAAVRRGDAPVADAPADAARAADPLTDPPAEAPVDGRARDAAAVPSRQPTTTAATPAPIARAAPSTAPPPTLDDVVRLTKDSEFSRFVARDVDPDVRNAAMRKLFASDPHFNTMDGLDVYIDDFNLVEPLPRQVLRRMVVARTLGLIDDDLDEQPTPDLPDGPEPDEDPDLQLQPDDAAGRTGAGAGAAGRADPGDTVPGVVPPRSD